MKTRIFRWLLAIGAWVLCAMQFAGVLNSSGGYGGIPTLLFAFAALILGVVLVSPEIVIPIAGWVGDLFVEVIQPGARLEKPPLSYLLAHRYRDQMRLPEAIEEYENILHYYPGERAAYEELLAVATMAGHGKTVRKFQRKFERRFGHDHPPALPAD